MTFRLLEVAAIPLVLPAATMAGATSTAGPTEAACELHIWPAGDSLAVLYYNPVYSGRDRAFVGIRGNPPAPKALSPANQIALLQQTNLAQLFGLPAGTTVIAHEVRLSREDAIAAKRHSGSASPCQSELVVQSVVYESADRVSRSLRVTITFQSFVQGRDTPATRFTTSAKARVVRFPATKPDEIAAANADLENAFHNAVVTFAGYANRSATAAKSMGNNQE